MQVSQEDITLERLANSVGVQAGVLLICVHHPFGADAILSIVLQTAVSEVIVQREHAARMCTIDIILNGLAIAVAVENVLPFVHRMSGIASQWVMMFPVPVLKLQVVDMVSSQQIQYGVDLCIRHIAER